MNQKNDIQWDFGIFIVLGLLLGSAAIDLVGHLVAFLYGEYQYFMVGLLVVAFIGAVIVVATGFNSELRAFESEFEKNLAEHKRQVDRVERGEESLHEQIEFMRKSFEKHWSLCEKIINKAEELLKHKAPILIPVPEESHNAEVHVQEAIEEVVGGAL